MFKIQKLKMLLEIEQAGEKNELYAKKCGLVHIISKVRDETIVCNFKEFLLILNLRKNLISVNCLNENGANIKFENGITK